MIAVNDLLPNMISKFNDLALFRYVLIRSFTGTQEVTRFVIFEFRRSIKIVELHNPDTLAKFTRIMGQFSLECFSYIRH